VTAGERIRACNDYLDARTGCYEYRRIRYLAALTAMQNIGLDDSCTIVDVGAGWTELDVCLRVDGGWKGRYIPVDGGIDGTDIARWWPAVEADFFVGLEIHEHLDAIDAALLVVKMKEVAGRGVILSTPNPKTTDVLGMDPTHKTEVHRGFLEKRGFTVRPESFYGQPRDSLFAVWAA
jgi:hypothetical protein